MKKLLIIVLFLFAAFPLFSRDITVFVMDFDLDLPLEGAVIRTRDGREFISDSEGKALIQASSGQFVIHAFYPGYETGILLIPALGDLFTLHLRLSGIMQGRELVVEAARPGTNETRTGRSVSVTSREISQTAEIGIIEDVMSTIKLLPGVNYSGLFNALPSIRGGHPGDMSAALDGYYIVNPFFWGGGFSIFDPRMVQSAQLSHGVFSSRYGHTISGLLEVTSKEPSFTETLFELGLSTSAANFNLSVPLGKGGIIFMGRITYYDPVISIAQSLSGIFPELQAVNFIRQAPYIRAATINANYRFRDNLMLTSTAFWGMDGVSVYFLNTSNTALLNSETTADFDFTNFQGFITSAVSWNPASSMLLKVTGGAGYEDRIINGFMRYNIFDRHFSNNFLNNPNYADIVNLIENTNFNNIRNPYNFYDLSLIRQSDFLFNAQGRIDFDLKITEQFLFSAGLQEMYNMFRSSGDQKVTNDIRFANLNTAEQNMIKLLFFPDIPAASPVWEHLRVSVPIEYSPDIQNHLFTTSGYILGEYNSANNRIKAELGLRIDHFHLLGNGFSLSSSPALNPRLNLDFILFNNKGIFESVKLSFGTGLFSSINDVIFSAEKGFNIQQIKPNRSWTSIMGIRFEFPESLSLNIETYYKYIFDRMYIPMAITLDNLDINPQFDGEGMVWGIDVMLHKVQSRFWDGWLSYSFNWTKYRDPQGRYGVRGIAGGNRGDDWYFPSFHRFHNLNLVFNYKPAPNMNLYMRFGLASGIQFTRRIGDGPVNYPVLVYDNQFPYFIEKFFWPSVIDESNRTTPSLPLDIKFSIFGGNRNGKTRYEIYVALENILAFVYTAAGNTSFNQYTGQVDTGSSSASYEIPMPIPSFGFRISY
jgi:hypothetical protein